MYYYFLYFARFRFPMDAACAGLSGRSFDGEIHILYRVQVPVLMYVCSSAAPFLQEQKYLQVYSRQIRLPYRYSRYCTCRTNTDVTFGG